LYDKNIYKEEDYLKLFFICSKDNPVRILDKNGKSSQTYLIKNHLDEVINPTSIKIDQFVYMKLFIIT
jgi:hypothetical protein